ncbi:hypothetical protein F5144DRAFT_579130 [Chaetomium tenue]|uniref:Uncharacterized protein n=1 Tax=Chaetomium tenue TaxID=1854479 RepID=A0ACB7P353_9PEZI|nr:hypothetical protein F5144DRAFT_579130 [Chaetomium globosum]
MMMMMMMTTIMIVMIVAILVRSLETPNATGTESSGTGKALGGEAAQVCQATRPGICGLLTATHGWLRVSGGPGLALIRGTLEARLEMHPLGQRGSKWPRLVELGTCLDGHPECTPDASASSSATLQDDVEQQKALSGPGKVRNARNQVQGGRCVLRNANKGLHRIAGGALAGSSQFASRNA